MALAENKFREFSYNRVPLEKVCNMTEKMSGKEREWQLSSLLATIPKEATADTVIHQFLMPWMHEHNELTAQHMERVGQNALQFGIAYGKVYPQNALSETELLNLYYAAVLHDIGKLAVPKSIFEEKNGISPSQRKINDQHPYFTYFILNQIPCLKHLAEASSLHHEMWNGHGPAHLKQNNIPFITQVISLADSFDYIVSDRPHYPAQSMRHAYDILRRHSGIFFSKEMIKVMDSNRFIFTRDPKLHAT